MKEIKAYIHNHRIADVIRTAYQGDVVGQVYEGNRVFNMAVILDPRKRKNIVDVGSLLLRNPNGTYVHLNQLADIYESSGRDAVLHNGARRVQAITSNVTGRDAMRSPGAARTDSYDRSRASRAQAFCKT